MDNAPVLMIVDDDPAMAEIVETVAKGLGYDTRVFQAGHDFMAAMIQGEPRVIVIDVVMPDMDGIELLRWLAQRNTAADIVVMSGYETQYMKVAEELGKAKGLKMHATIRKPFTIGTMREALSDLLKAK